MTTGATALLLDRVSLNVADLTAATAFYTEALDFIATPAVDADPRLVNLFGARTLRVVLLRRGQQRLELAMFDPPGASYPSHSRSNDLWFQHCALVTDDIGEAHERLSRFPFTPISRNGPQALPGGIVAFKFRDPYGHPLELIQFQRRDSRTEAGIDHSAISVADAERSIAFYGKRLGLSVQSRQVNTGLAQDALDDLDNVVVDVVSLVPKAPAPHVELLGYRAPPGRESLTALRSAIAASRLVFAMDSVDDQDGAVALADGTRACLIQDPDGHTLLLEQSWRSLPSGSRLLANGVAKGQKSTQTKSCPRIDSPALSPER
jgi:catechol 2,3-dioxygenase-like lactoylglutathione lyase family enzyme